MNDASSTTSGSWMDYSIRMHLRHASGLGNDADDSSGYIAMPLPLGVSGQIHNSDVDVDGATLSVAVAELVEDVHTNNGPQTIDIEQVELSQPRSYDVSTQNDNAQQEEHRVNMTKRTFFHQCFERRRNRFETCSASRFIIPRTSLPYTIERDPLTMRWVAIIHIDQEILDHGGVEEDKNDVIYLSYATINEAREACHAFAPPRMHSFEDYKNCFICKRKFHKVMRRPSNCRNCGVCVCSQCSTNWPRAMLPETYQWRKSKRYAKVCFACDWLNDTFRLSLMDGDHDKALALYCTGNVNLRCPFAKTKHDIYYPVHCAILGGNLSTLKWLVDQHCCPITSRTNKTHGDNKNNEIGNEPILTSKGSSVLALAMETHLLDIQRYLIVDKKINIFEYTNLRVALKNLAFSLHHLPES